MSQRTNTVRIQTLTKSQYNLSKNVPEAVPKKNLIIQRNVSPSVITPTPLPFDLIERLRSQSPDFRYYSSEEEKTKKGIRSFSEEKGSSLRKNEEHDTAYSSVKRGLEGRKTANPEEERGKQRYDINPLNSDRTDKKSRVIDSSKERGIVEITLNEKKSQLQDVQSIPKGLEHNKSYGNFNEENRTEFGSIKRYDEPSANKQNNTIIKLQDENILLKNENEGLKIMKKSLEAEINSLKKQNGQIDFDASTKLANIQEENQTNIVLYQHEKAASERLRNLLQVKIDEWALKEKEYGNEKVRITDENAKLKNNIYDLEAQINHWKAKANENEYNTMQYKQLGRQEAEDEKRSLLLQVQGYKTKSQESESIIALLKQENEDLQQNNLDLAKQSEEWRTKFHQLEAANNSNQLKASEEIRKKMADEITQINLSRAQEKEKYKTQRAELKARLGELENRLILTCGENERLSFSLKEKEKEIDNLKAKLLDKEQIHTLSITQLQNQLNESFNQRIDSEVKKQVSAIEREKTVSENSLKNSQVLTKELEERNRVLEKEVESMRQENLQKLLETEDLKSKVRILEEKERDAFVWKEKYENLQRTHLEEIMSLKRQFEHDYKLKEEKSNIESELAKIRAQRDEYQAKNASLIVEMDRINEITLDLVSENKDLKLKIQSLSNDLMEAKLNDDSEARKALELELEEAEKRFTNERNKLEKTLFQQKSKEQELQAKLVLFNVEIERLQGIITEKENNSEGWRKKSQEIQASYQSQIEELQSKNTSLKRSIDEDTRRNQQWESTKLSYETKIKDLSKEIQDLEQKKNTLNFENTNLRDQLASRNSEFDKLQKALYQIQIDNNKNLNEIRNEAQNKARIDFEIKFNEVTNKHIIEKTQLENQIKQSRDRIMEFERHLKSAQEQNEKLALEVRGRQTEIDGLKSRCNQLEKNSSTALKDLTDRLERQKTIEIEEALKRSNFLSQSEKEHFETKERELEQKNDLLESQIRDLRQKLGDSQLKNSLLTSEVDKCNDFIKSKDKEIDNLNNKVFNLEYLKERQFEDYKHKYELQKNDLITQEVRAINDKFSQERYQYENKIHDLKQQVLNLEVKLSLLTADYEKLNTRNKDNVVELEKLKQKESQMYLENYQLKETIDSLKVNKNAYNENKMNAEKAFIEAQISELNLQTRQFEHKISELTKENQLLKNQINVMEMEAQRNLERSRNDTERVKKSAYNYDLNPRGSYQGDRENNEEIIKLQSLLQKAENEKDYLSKALQSAREEINKNSQYYKELEAEYMLLNGKYEQLYKESEELQYSKNAYNPQSDITKQDIAQKHKELVSKIQEVDDLKTRYEEALASIDPVATGTSRIITRISIRKDGKT